MACTYTYQGKTYNAWEFADLLASMPVDELAGFLPSDALSNIKSMASKSSAPEAINVDGVERPTRNSKGQLIHPTEDGVRNFWKWFSPSPSQLLDGLSVTEISGLKRDTEALADFIESQSSLSESDRFKVIPASVFAHVAGAVDNAKILDAVVRSLPVDVVDFFARKQLSAEQALHDAAMLEDVFSIDPASDVTLAVDPSRVAELTVRVVANAGAKISGLANGALKRNAAVLTDANDPVLGAHVRKSSSGDLGIIAGFGDSKVVDADGRPLVVYHGTRRAFDAFTPSKPRGAAGNPKGIYFAPDKSTAEEYAQDVDGATDERSRVIDAYIKIENESDGLVKHSAYSGTEYIVFKPENVKSATGNIGAFDQKNPSIQASISFSPLDYIERLEKSDSLISQKIGSILGKTVELGKDVIGADSARTFNWWHKTVGSQMHKAKVSPAFRRVFNRAQAFIDDVSKYATVAANEAPDLLPKMDSFFQAVRDATNSIKDAKDQEAIAAPIFEGTLFEDGNGNIVGTVWTDDELRDRYSLTDRQIKLYRQFRAAVDKSLDDLAISEMNKVARANELIDPPSGSHMTLDRLASFYRGQYADKLAALNAEYDRISAAFEANDAQLKLNAERLGVSREKYFETKTQMHADYAEKQRALLAEMEELQRMETVFSDKVDTINKLKRQGYAPLMRFGKYTVDVVEMVDAIDEETGLPVTDQETGEIKQVENRIFFSMFETEREAREAERIMMEEYPQAKVTRGVNSEDMWQLYGKMNEGTLEALSKMIPSQDEVMQSFYKMAVSNRSALKRLIHRKGTEGYSKDVVRTLASFIMSNARASASFDHFGDIVEAAMEIPKEQGDVQKEAVKLINYIRDPNEEAGKFRGLLFMHFLGGSIASALVNLTQTISTTVPFLHQYGANVSDITKAGVLAAKRMKGGEATGIDRDLARALQLAEDEGIVAPHNIHALMGQTGTQGIAQHNRWFRLASHMWGSFFGMAEQFNRETAFISAYQLAKRLGDKGLKDAYDQQVKLNSDRGLPPPDRKIFSSPFEFAKNAVFETQFVLSKASRPNWARGAVGATLFTFKQFSVMYLELFNRLPNKERAIMLGALVLLAGIGGLPFGDDLEDLIDTMGQSAGYNTNSGKWKDDLIRDLLGNNKVASEFVLNGVTAFLPMDVANRLGMGNLLPATGLLKRSNGGNFGKEMSEFLGAGGAYARQLVDAWTAYQNTGRMSSLLQVAPKAIKDAAKGFEIASTGEYTDTRGRLVAEASGIDALVKMLGFQPVDIAAIQREKGYQMQDIALVKAVKASIAEMWAKGIYSKEPETKQKARELLEEWNAKNPEAKIRIDLGAVQRRVKQMGMTAAERLEKTAPKEMRRQVREAFAE